MLTWKNQNWANNVHYVLSDENIDSTFIHTPNYQDNYMVENDTLGKNKVINLHFKNNDNDVTVALIDPDNADKYGPNSKIKEIKLTDKDGHKTSYYLVGHKIKKLSDLKFNQALERMEKTGKDFTFKSLERNATKKELKCIEDIIDFNPVGRFIPNDKYGIL